jgi:hypothetical protein
MDDAGRWEDAAKLVGWAKRQDRSDGVMKYYTDEKIAEALDTIISLVRKLAAIYYRDGYRDGNSMLVRMANDELSVGQLTKLSK